MSKQVEDNKEMQEDLKKREAELKREMEEKRQVRCNVSQCIWSALSVCLISKNRGAEHVLASVLECISAICSGLMALESDQNLIKRALAFVCHHKAYKPLSELSRSCSNSFLRAELAL